MLGMCFMAVYLNSHFCPASFLHTLGLMVSKYVGQEKKELSFSQIIIDVSFLS